MTATQKFIIVPFHKSRGKLVVGEMRQATNAASAERIANSMAPRHVGVAAYSVMVDQETGDMTSPRLLAKYGEIGDLEAE